MTNEIATEFIFTWKIENYSLFPQKIGEFLLSPLFTTENVGDSIWVLYMYPRGEDVEAEEYISLYLNRYKYDIRDDVNNIDVELKIIGSQGNTLQIVKGENLLIRGGHAWGSKRFFKRIQMEKWKEDAITISCTIVNRKRLSSKAKTKIDSEHYSLMWIVGIPENMDMESQKECDTPLFRINLATSDDNIKLTICKREDIAIFPKRVSCKISLLNIHGCEIDSRRAAHSFLLDKEDHVWEFPNFITTGYLRENAGTILSNGTFTLLFEFSFSKEKETINILIPDGNNYPKQNSIIDLRESLRNMYASGLHSDIEFRVDGRTFHVHKSILAARSPVFSAMFVQDMLESRTGVVNISNIESNIFESFLEYVYTATVEIMNWEIASKLLMVADQYQVNALRVDCSCFLKSNLNKQNFYEVLELSDVINYKNLKEFMFDYIADNVEEILTSPQWMDWAENNSRLSAEVMVNIPEVSENAH